MKLTGITGTGTGKLGSSVFAVNAGTQIVRQYQPVVTNPSTTAQVEQRAKLKLASQLARDLKKSIAIPREGLVSSRNRFMSKNFSSITYEGNTAQVNLPNVQLTESNLSFPAISITSEAGADAIRVVMNDWIAGQYEKIQVEIYNRNADGSLSFIKSETKDAEDADLLKFVEVSLPAGLISVDTVVFAYGFNLTSDRARAAYTDMVVNTGATIASLVTSRVAVSSDVQLSRTVGTNVTIA